MQMKLMFLILAGLLFWSDLLSQWIKSELAEKSVRRVFRISMPDTTNRKFLSRHDSLKSITVVYKEEQPYFLFLNFNESNPRKERKHFDLALAGDRYLLEKKYGRIRYVNTEQIDQLPWPKHDKTIILTGVTFNGDSVYYRGDLRLPNEKGFDPDWTLGSPARYQGDINMLAEKIAERLAKEREGAVVDSALVFEGKVTKQFLLKDLRLVLGEKSVFSNVAAGVLLGREYETGNESSRADWFPASIDRGPIEVKTKIFVKLEKDGTVTIETPRRLRTFTRG